MKAKQVKAILIALAFALLISNVFGQTKTNSFQVKISGKGKQAIPIGTISNWRHL